jgi:hypothetical protein
MKDSTGTGPAPAHWGESTVEWTTAAALVGAGMASGFTHIVANSQRHGVTSWLAWAIAVTIELTALYAVVKLRHRLAESRPVWPPAALLVAGFSLSLASQLAQAESSAWGWIYNGWPVVGGLWVAKLTLSDLGHRAEVSTQQRRVLTQHEDRVLGLMAQVDDRGQRLGQAEGQAGVMTQRVTQVEAERDAEVARLGGEVRRLTALLETADGERPKRRLDRPERERQPDTACDDDGGERDESLTGRAARLAVTLRDQAGGVWPTQGALAEAADVSVSTAKRVLRELRTPGLTLVEDSA